MRLFKKYLLKQYSGKIVQKDTKNTFWLCKNFQLDLVTYNLDRHNSVFMQLL